MRSLLAAAILVSMVSVALGQHTRISSKDKEKMNLGLFTPDKLEWKDGPDSLQKGSKMVLLEGNPAREGVFTMRLKLPKDFVVAPHVHSQIEHVTVISGKLHFGMGDKFDRNATQEMPAGSFGFWPIGMQHFAWVGEETVLQLHGQGPWTVTYLNPADDPRKAGK